MSFLDAPAPREGLSPADTQRALDAPPGLGEYLRANVAEGFWATGLGQITASNRINEAGAIAEGDDAAPMDQTSWSASEFARKGVAYRPGMTRAVARELADQFDENTARRRLIGQRDADTLDTVLGFGAGVVGALPTPENFIPFAGPALNAARAGRFGTYLAGLGTRAGAAAEGTVGARAAYGAATGAVDAFGGNLVVAPFVHGSRRDFGDDVTFATVMQDLALGTVGGAVLGGGLGAALGRARAPLPATTQDAALRGLTGAAAQLADGVDIDLSAAAPALRQQLQALHAEARNLRSQLTEQENPSLAARTAAREPLSGGEAAPGVETRATTPAGTEVRLRYDVVEADSLVASHSMPDFAENPAFAGELQPRDRSTAERQAQVRNIAARLRPEELQGSPLTTMGAPIVGPDHLVESGNGRVLAITSAYRDNLATAGSYREALVRQGFEDAATMREPVLIRRRVSDLDTEGRRRFVNESNVDSIDALTPAEQARVDAQAITPEILGLLRSNDMAAAANTDFARAFIGALPGREQRALSREGALTPDGITRLRRAMAARAYDDAALLTRLAESPDGAAETIGRGLLDAAPAIAALRAAREAGQLRPELDAVPALVRAVQRIQAARDANMPLRSALDQLDLFDTSNTAERAFLELLLRHPKSNQVGGVGRATIAERLDAFARHAREAPNEPDMFGTAPPGLGDVLAATFREAGLEPPANLRSLRSDVYVPPARDVPEPPPTEAPGAAAATGPDQVARAAAGRGLDVETGHLDQQLQTLVEADRLPPEIAAQVAEIEALSAKVERAEDTWQAAATCVIKG